MHAPARFLTVSDTCSMMNAALTAESNATKQVPTLKTLFRTPRPIAMLAAVAVLFLAGGVAEAQRAATGSTAVVPTVSTPIMPLDQVQTGMKGIGKTVFTGNRIEEFQAEILGVLRNVTPQQSLIMA